MELLLNLAWVLLALPAYWVWRRGTTTRSPRIASPPQCLLALGCVLVLLFPVISASDDLHAMRAEMEESASSKRALRQAATGKDSAGVSQVQGPAAIAAGAAWLPVLETTRLKIFVISLSPLARPCGLHIGRSPPFSFPG